ncbi:TPA: type I methionyl aminopeptidase [Candidatus Dependentiae bacterium]|nr:MAG: Methionine aminopeptidase [candidate division TM6 bacterium GW2011_GWF2_36_131]KKQ03065.1 MAG: Methionine aminopeptidase [candidate division TM6 bacterium GW2011_GWE2_36_25]KKQ19632.1 MAG: Methionine aminopeptidase [candidate division TM6 bacterium GW2011_GWA2_36_9]HBR71147.1 type I methionyl aminopeptidase [Candidatus Dependentiae bacterium]HCU00476.1 type I methionyl aminopeptidase [Candidatus Dependentiae bacterium]
MITLKNSDAIKKMREGGQRLATVFDRIAPFVKPGISSLALDEMIEKQLQDLELKAEAKGYHGYKHVSCISFNDEVVHGIPAAHKIIQLGDLIKVDICVSWHGYCVDMARSFAVGVLSEKIQHFVHVAKESLDAGIAAAQVGACLSDISATIQQVVEQHRYGIVRNFAGHGIGVEMHEEPEIPNFGKFGKGPVLKAGMTLAIEPMITVGDYRVYIATDGWTVKTRDKSWAAHVEDTVLITNEGPEILTRPTGVRV